MIIPRKYETYRDLCINDKRAREVIFRYLDSLPSDMSKDEAIDSHLSEVFIYQSEMGCGVSDLTSMLDELDALDNEYPYDNGLSYNDVSEVITLPNEEGDSISMIMVMDNAEVNRRIVKVITIKTERNADFIAEISDISGVIF